MIGNLTDEVVKIRVPIEFPLDTSLSYCARIVGMAIQIGIDLKYDTNELLTPEYLGCQLSKMQRTIGKAIVELKATNWPLDKPFEIKGKFIEVSNMLILDKKLTNCAKLLFCFLLILEVISEGLLETRFSELHKMFGLGYNTVKRGFAALRAGNWLTSRQKNKHALIRIWLDFPLKKPLEYFSAMIKEIDQLEHDADGKPEQVQLQNAGRAQGTCIENDPAAQTPGYNMRNRMHGTSKIEKLVLGALTVIVDSDYYDDHYTPKFFPNWGTDHQMHFDRIYHRHAVAIEVNGPQHYHETEWFDAKAVAQQKWCDNTKRENSRINDVTLIELTLEDLSVEKIQDKIKDHLPLRELPLSVIKYMNNRFMTYLNACKSINPKQAVSAATG